MTQIPGPVKLASADEKLLNRDSPIPNETVRASENVQLALIGSHHALSNEP